MSCIVVLRHGNTFVPGEEPQRIGARTDLALVASGIEQADAVGRHFARLGFAFRRVLAAPLRRTRQTAARVVSALGLSLPVETADWLTEIDHGPDEGMPEGSVTSRIGAEAIAAWGALATVPPGWLVDREARLNGWHRFLAQAHDDGDVLLVTSNGAARFALLALPLAARPPMLKLGTGAFGVLRRSAAIVDGDAGWTVEAWDVRPPLGPAGDTPPPR